MHLKTKLALFYLIIVLFSIACVSASDVNSTDVVALADEVEVDSVGGVEAVALADEVEVDSVALAEDVKVDSADVNGTGIAAVNPDDNLTAVSDDDVIAQQNSDVNKTDSLKTSVSVQSDNKIQSPNNKNVVSTTAKKSWISPIKYTIAQGTYYKVCLKGSDGKLFSKVPVTMTIKGKDYHVKTNSVGIARLKINLNYGKYAIKVSFAGNSKYKAITKWFNFFVGKTTYVVIGNDRILTNGYLRIYLKSSSGFGLVAKKTLKINVGGKRFTKVTNSEGMVVFKPSPSKGYKNVDVTFDGTFNIVGSHASKRLPCYIGNAKNPFVYKIPTKNGVPDVDYMVSSYVMGDGNARYTLLKSQYLQVIKRDSYCLFLFNKLTKYTFFKTKSEPNYNHLVTRTKWNVIERELNTRVVPQNEYNCWPDEITVSLKGRAYIYPEVRDVQDTGYTCGPTSSSMCSQVLRCYINEQYLASQSGSNPYDGSSTSGLKAGLESFNMQCKFYYRSSFDAALEELKKGGCALIFHTWNHYVAILDISKDGSQVLVGNPSGDYDHGSHGIPTNWLSVDYMYSCFNDYDTSGLIVKLKYSLSQSTKSQLNKFYQNMGSFTRQNTNERIPNIEY